MSRRDGAIVAWHEVPGAAPPQKSRPVGYGVIRAGVRTDSMIGVTKFRMPKLKTFMLYVFWPTIQFLSMANTFSCLNIHCVFSTKERVWVLNPDLRERLWPYMGARSYRTLRDGSFEGRFPRHFVPGYDRCCPYGTRLQTFRNSI